MNKELNYINVETYNASLKILSSKDLKDYNGGGFIFEGIAWLLGAFNEHLSRQEMSVAEKEAFIAEHGLRD